MTGRCLRRWRPFGSYTRAELHLLDWIFKSLESAHGNRDPKKEQEVRVFTVRMYLYIYIQYITVCLYA